MKRELYVGQAIVFIDEFRNRLPALVTAIHGELTEHGVPCINLVHISQDNKRLDQYGRQIEHRSSVVHHSTGTAVVGWVWHWPDEDVQIDESSVATQR